MTGFASWKIPTGHRWKKSRNSRNCSAHRQLLPLAARRAEKENLQLACIRIEFTDHLQLATATLEAGHREPLERAVGRRLGRLIIFPALKPSGGIHAHSLRQASDKDCPRRMFQETCVAVSNCRWSILLFAALALLRSFGKTCARKLRREKLPQFNLISFCQPF